MEARIMPQVALTIAGRTYRVACGEGEEAHLHGLARDVDEKIDLLKQSFGEIGDQRLTIMAALTFADDLSEARQKVSRLEAEIAILEANSSDVLSDHDALTVGLADRLDEAAERIERATQALNGGRANRAED
jgi:cell division protein ZapA